MTNQKLQTSKREKIKEEFEKLWKRIWENHASSLDNRMIWNVNDDDDPDDGWEYADETILSFFDSHLTQATNEGIKIGREEIYRKIGTTMNTGKYK